MPTIVDPTKGLEELEAKFKGVTDPTHIVGIALKEIVAELIKIRAELTTLRFALPKK